MNGADERALAGKSTGTISFNDFYGKSFSIPGQLDTTFNIGTGFDGNVYTTLVQSDGKIVVGGRFTRVNGGRRNRLARLFVNGVAETGSGSHANNTIRTLSIHDNKIFAGGDFTAWSANGRVRILRLATNSWNIVDSTFLTGSGASSRVLTTSVQSDGKVLIGGAFASYGGVTVNGIARLHVNGVRDTTFNTGSGPNSIVRTSARQSDGKFIIGGNFTSYGGVTINRIARLHVNGVRDTTFNVGTGASDNVWTTSIQSDGKVIIGGAFASYRGVTTNRIARLHVNGVRDTTFNTGSGTNNVVTTSSIQSDGKVIIGGAFTSYSGVTTNRIARLHANGVRDTTFNVGSGANNAILTTSVQSDGKVIIGGYFTSYGGVTTNRIARIDG
jgi:uncharacterized delta-60 repeat protein